MATIFVDSFSPYINLKIESGKCIIAIESDYGKIEYKSKIKYTGPMIEFGINPEFLKNMMKYSTIMILSKDSKKLRLETKDYSIVSALYGQE